MTKGIRILDKKGRVVAVELPAILKEIHDGHQFAWSILYLQATGDLGEKTIPAFEQQIIESEKGFLLTWEELIALAPKFWDLMDIILIGCKKQQLLRRYPTDQEMYATCDIVIAMIDSSYWEVFSHNPSLIDTLTKKFNQVKPLTSDFEH